MILKIKTPEWAIPLLEPCRYKGAKGGRGSGKSHFFAEAAVEAMGLNPNTNIVCIREVQKSLKFSAKKLIEDKIRSLDLSHYFQITLNEIRSVKGSGIIIFQGMQDHTADSIKSLEGFDIAWCEEAQSLSDRSLQLLRPTIRAENSELWFSWNPDLPTDPIDLFFKTNKSNSILVHVNSEQNPFLSDTLRDERDNDRIILSAEDYAHIWDGEYNLKSDALIFKDKYKVDLFIIEDHWQPLHGLDWGFSQDPTCAVRVYVENGYLYVSNEAGAVGLELDGTPDFMKKGIPGIDKYVIRADNARPESISHVRRKGLPKIKGEAKLKIQDGIEFMRSFKSIIIHPSCKEVIKEFSLYKYKEDKRTQDILPEIVDKNNHYIDAIRYALYPLITKKINTRGKGAPARGKRIRE